MIVNLVRSELRKTFSVKLWWALGLCPLLVGVLSGSLSLAVFSGTSDGGDFSSTAISGVIGLLTALYFLLMFSSIFGAVSSAGEYRQKTITTTFLTTSSRGQSLLAKFAVCALVGLLYAVVIEVVTISLIAIFGDELPGIDGEVLGFLAVAVVVTMLWTVMGAGLGTLLTSSVGSAVGIVVYYLLGEILLTAVLRSAGAEEVARFLPQQATLATLVGLAGGGGALPWWGALLVLTGWAVALCTGGWAATRVRDVE